jgi:hypothetical protein
MQPSHEAFKSLQHDSLNNNRIALSAFASRNIGFHLEDVAKRVRMLKQSSDV